jgi:hypothetical protein
MRTREVALQTASGLFDGELSNLRNNPADFCRAMGWNKDSPGTNKAINKAEDICQTSDDVNKLADIIQSQGDIDLIDIVESGDVQDFLTNTVAKYIQA